MLYLDTHVVVWLYAGQVERFTAAGRRLLESETLFVSPIVSLELEYLRETGRIKDGSSPILSSLARAIGLTPCDCPFTDVVSESLRQTWTRDPFDRLIVGQAIARNAPLLTKDASVRRHYSRACW